MRRNIGRRPVERRGSVLDVGLAFPNVQNPLDSPCTIKKNASSNPHPPHPRAYGRHGCVNSSMVFEWLRVHDCSTNLARALSTCLCVKLDLCAMLIDRQKQHKNITLSEPQGTNVECKPNSAPGGALSFGGMLAGTGEPLWRAAGGILRALARAWANPGCQPWQQIARCVRRTWSQDRARHKAW